MAEDLFVELGEDGNLWITSRYFGTAVALCREVKREWYAAEDHSFNDQVGPFPSLEDFLDHIEERKLFSPWDSPGF